MENGARKTSLRAQAAALAAIALIPYLPALRGGWLWDDNCVTEYPVLLSGEGPARIWLEPSSNPKERHYLPVVYTCFWIQHRLWGLAPAGYHLTNLLFHAATALVLWRLLARLRIPGAWLAGAFFAVHPVHAESVAWVIELKDILSALFYMAAFHAYLRWEGRPAGWAAAQALYLLGILSKSVIVSLPIGIAIALWWRDGRLERRHWLPLAAMAAMGAAISLVDMRNYHSHVVYQSGLSPLDRIALLNRVVFFQGFKALWPSCLMALYPRWDFARDAALHAAIAAGSLALVAGLWAGRARWGRGPLAAALFFAATVAPPAGLADFGFLSNTFVAHRYQYLAIAGPIALACAGAARGFAARPRLGGAASAFILAILAVMAWRQSLIHENTETLFRSNLAKNPRSAVAHNYVGLADEQRGEFAEAERHFREALSLRADYPEALNNLGALLGERGRIDEAAELFARAVVIQPGDAELQNNLGLARMGQARYAEAAGAFERATALAPGFAEARQNLDHARSFLDGRRGVGGNEGDSQPSPSQPTGKGTSPP